MLDNVASPAVRQKRSKLAPTSCQASSMFAAGTRAVNVVGFFMALLSFRGFDASSLAAQGEQRLPLIFNIQRGNAIKCRHLYKDFFEFDPQFKLWLATNNLPDVSGSDDAVWR